jgi:CBS domain-containing protein
MAATMTRARLALRADSAADLMSPNPVSVRARASLREAIALMTDRGIRAAPVIDEGGHPVGVVSQTDIVVHDRERPATLEPIAEFYHWSDLTNESGDRLPTNFLADDADRTTVGEVMSPAVFAVDLDTQPAVVVQRMLDLGVHRLFVRDAAGTLVGVISTTDILRHLGF